MDKWKCIIVDDEDVDRLMVLSFAKRFTSLEICGTFKSSQEALAFLENETVDILFLDIDMQSLNGLELRKKVSKIPICIYISGYPEYAIESFELETLDFIVKPLKFDRFEKTMKRVSQFMEVKQKASLFETSFSPNTINIKDGNKLVKLKHSDILYLEALKDYTIIFTLTKKYCVWSNIGSILKQEFFLSFIRIHRSYAIQKQFINNKNATTIFLENGIEIPIGRSYKNNLKSIL
jgi:two-component system, LytTR family, response regulator